MSKHIRRGGLLQRRNGLIVRGNSIGCCCDGGGGGDGCACAFALLPPCPGDVPSICCEALEYTATIAASGAARFTVDNTYWAANLIFGLGDAGAPIPPPPLEGVIYDGAWTLNETITRRCLPGNVTRILSSGSLSVNLFYWGLTNGGAPGSVYARIPFVRSLAWTGVVVGEAYGFIADANRKHEPFASVPGFGGINSRELGLFPPRTAPTSGCVEAFPEGSLAVGSPGWNFGLTAFPSFGLGTPFFVQTTGSNTCAVRRQSALAQWRILSFPFTTGDLVDAGAGTQSYDWLLTITSTGCPTPSNCFQGGALDFI